MNPESRKYPEEIQEMRDSLAGKVKEIRAERDDKNEQADTILAKAKDVLGMKKGSSDLRYEAKLLDAEARETLRLGKAGIEIEKEGGIRKRVLYHFKDFDLQGIEDATKYFGQPEIAEWVRFALGSKAERRNVVQEFGGYFSSIAPGIPTMEPLNEVLASLCLENIDLLKEELSAAGYARVNAFNLFGGILHVTKNQKLRKVVSEELEKYLPEVFEYLTAGRQSSFYTVEAMLKDGNAEVKSRFENFLIRRFEENKDYITMARVIESVNQPKMRDIGIKIVEAKVQETYGFKIDIINDWLEGNNHNAWWNISGNLEAMDILEQAEKGAVRFLNQEFGIVEFSRYPEEILLKQVREADQNLPYGIVIFPRTDHNGAFDQDKKVLLDISDQLDKKYSIRIFECGSRTDIARALLKCNKKYGEKNKIEFAVLGGHGTAFGMEFGNFTRSQGYLGKDDIRGRGTVKMAEFFNPNPTIVLFSCSTGKPGGFGQILSEVGKARVIAPKVPTNAKSVTVSFSEGRPQFSVEYNDPGIASEYNMGKPEGRPKPRIGLF